ncbi:hypothetical protein Sspor_80480 [Streptomyces spororaveus]|uniref:Uncharacterized protein n=1 Tax=Streptomyces spororaveus TaxID=284039 RepID=A0ABQ3TR13_9ACTN|nr:hypothetical protein Sspor_80480 [Streptomyces spororaveus]
MRIGAGGQGTGPSSIMTGNLSHACESGSVVRSRVDSADESCQSFNYLAEPAGWVEWAHSGNPSTVVAYPPLHPHY